MKNVYKIWPFIFKCYILFIDRQPRHFTVDKTAVGTQHGCTRFYDDSMCPDHRIKAGPDTTDSGYDVVADGAIY